MTDWQTMDSAPRDGTDVLLFFPLDGLNHEGNPRVIIASWRQTRQGMSWIFQNRAVRGYSDAYQPTHWMSLPSHPVDAAA